ncbi:MAG: ATP-binding protein [Ilumatobacteraceae bacterium]
MQAGSRRVDNLISIVEPLNDSNNDLFREMVLAKTELLKYRDSRDRNSLASFLASKVTIVEALDGFQNEVVDSVQHFESASELKLTNLATIQQESVQRWLDYSTIVLQAENRKETAVSVTEAVLFNGFVQANQSAEVLLENETIQARITARSQMTRGLILTTAVILLTSLLMTILGIRFARKISKPIVELRKAVKRQREGDLSARASENQGSTEIEDLARNFNLLVEHDSELRRIQSLALRMHDLTVRIEHAIRIAPDTQQALEILCVGLGEGFGVDRVMANTMGVDQGVQISTQWFRPDLPPLGDIPVEYIPYMRELVQDLWDSSGHLITSDRPTEVDWSEHDKIFYRSTGACASIIVPIGLGDQVVGMIYVITVDSPRLWADSEVQAVERVAAFLAQFFVEQTYRDQLNEHVEQLEQINRQKDTFVATVSHELRTPLTSIIGYLEVLRDGFAGDLSEEQARMLGVIDRNSSRLLSLIEHLLALNKREAVKTEFLNVSMPELITSVCHDLSPLAESGAIKIDCDAGPERAVVHGDRGQLQSAIVNIVSNAIKFSHRDGVVTISCSLDEFNRNVQITCNDHGIGIPAIDQGELFTRFYRASNAMANFVPGTGLGLAIVKQIVDDHGGEIHLDSVEGKGTTVFIELPVSPQDSF